MIRETLRALVQPRRLIPIAIVMTPVLYMQWRNSWHVLALPIGMLLCLCFVVVAPASWRYLFPVDQEEVKDPLFRLGMYALLGAGVVSGIGSSLPRLLNMPATFLTHRPSLVACIALFWVGGWGLGRDIDFEQRLAHERARAALAHADADRARLLAVANHLDPHFLFNTLNAIAEWCREDGKVAEAAVLRLSALLRSIMEGIDQTESWSLEREAELVRGLWELHRIRDPEAFAFRIEVPNELGAREVPPLLLLGLAENAIKHGPAGGHRGEVTLSARADGAGMVLELENPGAYGGPRIGGQGVSLTERRARSFFGAHARVELAGQGARTRATLLLPAVPVDQVRLVERARPISR